MKETKRKYDTSRSVPTVFRKLIAFASPILRSFPIEIRGEENIPSGNVVFICNHSNSHDAFIAFEVFYRIKRNITLLAASDGLNLLSHTAFAMANTVFVQRDDKLSRKKGFEKLCSIIASGENVLIFPESTWNLHPVRPMLKLNAGFVRIAMTVEKPIVPVIFEYLEVPEKCSKESKLYKRCVVSIGKPFYPASQADLYTQTENVRNLMADMRKKLWSEFGIEKQHINAIDKSLYLNHLDIKKNHAFGFKYNSKAEQRFLIDKENEFFINEEGKFVPVIFSDNR